MRSIALLVCVAVVGCGSSGGDAVGGDLPQGGGSSNGGAAGKAGAATGGTAGAAGHAGGPVFGGKAGVGGMFPTCPAGFSCNTQGDLFYCDGTLTTLAAGCGAGKCNPGGGCFACTAGEVRCVNGGTEVCNASRTGWQPGQACPFGCDSSSGACRLCTPFEATCVPGGRQVCGATGLDQVVTSCPKTEPICALGLCLECLKHADCGAPTLPCSKRVCSAGACADAPMDQVPGDCAVVSCDVNGQPVKDADPLDLPPDDGNPCTADVCLGAAPAHPPGPDGMACPGGFCLGGSCK